MSPLIKGTVLYGPLSTHISFIVHLYYIVHHLPSISVLCVELLFVAPRWIIDLNDHKVDSINHSTLFHCQLVPHARNMFDLKETVKQFHPWWLHGKIFLLSRRRNLLTKTFCSIIHIRYSFLYCLITGLKLSGNDYLIV